MLEAFVAASAGAYSKSAIENFIAGVRAWHLLHNVKWDIDEARMQTLMRAINKLAPSLSKKKKRCPCTPAFLSTMHSHLGVSIPNSSPLNVAVFMCAMTCFYSAAHLGKLQIYCTDLVVFWSVLTSQTMQHLTLHRSIRKPVHYFSFPQNQNGSLQGECILGNAKWLVGPKERSQKPFVSEQSSTWWPTIYIQGQERVVNPFNQKEILGSLDQSY